MNSSLEDYGTGVNSMFNSYVLVDVDGGYKKEYIIGYGSDNIQTVFNHFAMVKYVRGVDTLKKDELGFYFDESYSYYMQPGVEHFL